jgi:hypothetical protein
MYMASIQKRVHPSGTITYRVRIRLSGSPLISESFPTRREAKEWASKMEADVRQGRYFGKAESKEHTFYRENLLFECCGLFPIARASSLSRNQPLRPFVLDEGK